MYILKMLIIIPFYVILVLAGFIGWGTNTKDKWDELVQWAKK